MTYQGIVNISNEIRFVLDTARQVNLTAQNASLAARRAGNVRGFQAVSTELKTFSHNLARAMSNMSGDILAIAQAVSGNYRETRLSGYCKAVLKLIGESSLVIGALEKIALRDTGVKTMLDSRLQGLSMQLSRSLRLCNNGRALARSAMIEASSGGESEAMLKQVAQDIERTIEDIHGRLKVIGMRLNYEQGNT